MVSTSSEVFFEKNLGLLGPIVTSLANLQSLPPHCSTQDQKKQKLIEAGIGLEWGDPRTLTGKTGGSHGLAAETSCLESLLDQWCWIYKHCVHKLRCFLQCYEHLRQVRGFQTFDRGVG